MRMLRNLGRRRLRTTLTILGITIGIWSLVVFGSMANKINALVAGGHAFFGSGAITVSSQGAAPAVGGPMSIAIGDRIAALDGVAAVVPGASVALSEAAGMSMGVPPMVTGEVAGADGGRTGLVLRYATGRALVPADEGTNVTVLGSDLARQYDKKVGDMMTLRGEQFTVVGVLEPTLTQPDNSAMVPLAAAQHLYVQSLPALISGTLDPADVATSFTVYPQDPSGTEGLAAAIERIDPQLRTMTASDFDEMAGSWAGILNSILVGIALISLAVGGLSVVNTMAMSIAERTREIGIKRAIGGSRRRIVRELVTESALIGFIGGAIGLILGALVVVLANEAGRSSGTVLFELTAGTALTAVGFSTILGAMAGFLPALRAARLDPVTALRYE